MKRLLLSSLLSVLVPAFSARAARAAPMPQGQSQLQPAQAATQAATKTNPKDGLIYVWIPPGKFMMGCSPGDGACDEDEKPAHEVIVTKGFWMAQTLVTQAAYRRVVGTNPSFFHGDRLPVDRISWDQAKSYCAAVGMRLPSEAEWEYAARANNPAARYAEADTDTIAWYKGNSYERSHEVALKQPNAWQLYDMLGNVWEWTSDWYNSDYVALRGGSWSTSATNIRVSARGWDAPNHHRKFTGFRCAGE
ncbi:MAG: formylglycine-generating enzyme family protein [Terriglobales bacterium]